MPGLPTVSDAWSPEQVARLLAARPDLAEPAPATSPSCGAAPLQPGSLARAVEDLPTAPRLCSTPSSCCPAPTTAAPGSSAPRRRRAGGARRRRDELEVRLLLEPGSRTVGPSGGPAPAPRRPARPPAARALTPARPPTPCTACSRRCGCHPGARRRRAWRCCRRPSPTPPAPPACSPPCDPSWWPGCARSTPRVRSSRSPGSTPGGACCRRTTCPRPSWCGPGWWWPRGGPYVELPAEVVARPAPPDAAAARPRAARACRRPSRRRRHRRGRGRGGRAHAVVALLDRLAGAVEAGPVPLLASGGVGVREVRRLADPAGHRLGRGRDAARARRGARPAHA